MLANAMCENLQFAQVFSTQGEIPLLTDLFGGSSGELFELEKECCFPVEPLSDDEHTNQMEQLSIANERSKKSSSEKYTQTEIIKLTNKAKKRPHFYTNPVEDEPQPFKLLQPPGNYTLTEMFDDLRTVGGSPGQLDVPSCSSPWSNTGLPQQSYCLEMTASQNYRHFNYYEYPKIYINKGNVYGSLVRAYSNPTNMQSGEQIFSQPFISPKRSSI
uniref:NFE2L2 n=1 Tax=Heterorhabditis bacteriophora TaxID=37862 RepID=A0A1I7X3X3_HETBA